MRLICKPPKHRLPYDALLLTAVAVSVAAGCNDPDSAGIRGQVFFIGNDIVLGMWRDELGVERVKLYELVKRGTGDGERGTGNGERGKGEYVPSLLD